MARTYGTTERDFWRRVPFITPLRRTSTAGSHRLAGTAWCNPARGLWAMRTSAGLTGRWVVFRDLPKLSLTLAGATSELAFTGFFHGRAEWGGRLRYSDTLGGWVLGDGDNPRLPVSFTDARYAAGTYSTFTSGDSWFFYRSQAANTALSMPFEYFDPGLSLTFEGHGPLHVGQTATVGMLWPRLERSGGETAAGEGTESPAGVYDQAMDGWTAPQPVRIGLPTFDTPAGEASMAFQWNACGDAVLGSDGVWRIGAQTADGAWLEAQADLREATAPGASVQFEPVCGPGFDDEAPEPQTWTSRGLSCGDRKRPLWVADIARWT